jgi:hypothetical protein
MGQLFKLSKMGALEGMMTQHIACFVRALEQQMRHPIEVVGASRALEADIVCEWNSVILVTAKCSLIMFKSCFRIRPRDRRNCCMGKWWRSRNDQSQR